MGKNKSNSSQNRSISSYQQEEKGSANCKNSAKPEIPDYSSPKSQSGPEMNRGSKGFKN